MDDPSTELHRLYWESDRSVNAIVEELGISKGRLYSLLEPLPAGVRCPECGAGMAYPNRTARERGRVRCPLCDHETERRELDAGGGGPPGGAREASADRSARRPAGEDSLPTRILAGAALLGIAAGIAVAAVLRRR